MPSASSKALYSYIKREDFPEYLYMLVSANLMQRLYYDVAVVAAVKRSPPRNRCFGRQRDNYRHNWLEYFVFTALHNQVISDNSPNPGFCVSGFAKFTEKRKKITAKGHLSLKF